MFRSAQKAFTLIEVLIVIGILGILATVALVAINPAEAQKKGRDAQRLKDIVTLQTAIEQYLADNPAVTISATAVSSAGGGTRACATGWIGFDVCNYTKTLPQDPSVGRTGTFTNNLGVTTGTASLKYTLKGDGTGGYKICTYMESATNKARVDNLNDGGVDNNRYETGSAMSIACE